MPDELHLYHWMITSLTSARRVRSRWRMTESDALALDPTAERLVDTLEVRRPAGSTSAWQRNEPDAPTSR